MRTLNQNSVFYAPETVPSVPSDIPAYLERELFKIKVAVDLMAAGHLDETHVAPTKPRTGDIRLADGANWNPGSGRGLYYYQDSAWNFLTSAGSGSSSIWESVRDYGAAGDGVANDSAAFTDTGSSASLVSAIVPPGTYLLNSSPTPTGAVVWDVLNGATFTGPSRLADNSKIIKRGNASTWVSASTLYSGIFAYLENNTTLNTYAKNICSFSAVKSSNLGGGASEAAIGKAAFAVNDATTGTSSVWALYGTAIRTGSYGGFTHALELDIANMGAQVAIYPNSMFPNGATNCLWLATGGEASNNSSVGTASCALGIVRNDSNATPSALYEKGIVFHSKAISGTDGATGNGIAIAFASRHQQIWFNNSNQAVGEIVCNAVVATNAIRMDMSDSGLLIQDRASGGILLHVNTLASPVNYLRINAALTTNAPNIFCAGTDVDIDLALIPKNAGLVKFGTYTAGAVAQAGYITIKDSAGNSRRLLVG